MATDLAQIPDCIDRLRDVLLCKYKRSQPRCPSPQGCRSQDAAIHVVQPCEPPSPTGPPGAGPVLAACVLCVT